MRSFLIILLASIFCCGCIQSDAKKVADLEERLAEANRSLQNHQQTRGRSQTRTPKGRLVHLVWFELKSDLSKSDLQDLQSMLAGLDEIEVVKDLEVGRFQDLGDKRALSRYQLVMQMAFDSQDEYHTYQKHPIHVELKNNVGRFLSGPPATYDYWSITDSDAASGDRP